MTLVKQQGNMYEFVTHMWSPVKGRCSHDCSYCYMKRFPLPEVHLNEKDLRNRLGENNFIFVGHTIDLFAEDVPTEWIEKTMFHCCNYPKNKYLFQSKNPRRMLDFTNIFPKDVLLGTTIETNRTDYYESKAPPYIERAKALQELSDMGFETMVTIEPIFDFDLDELVDLVITANPVWVNIGADSKGHKLPEPTKEQIIELVKTLKEKTDVELKRNLDRILGENYG
jgi:DNA repair photolyase